MTRVRVLTIVFAALVGTLAVGARQQVFRSTTEMVPVFVTVTDKSGRLVPDLERDVFEIRDNGKPQPIILFDNSPQPIRLIIMIDVSGSMYQAAGVIRRASIELLKNLKPVDLARVGTFGHEIIISPEFTRDVNALAAMLPTEIPMNAPTPLWAALDQAIGEFASAPPGRRVILVLSDSKDGGVGLGKKFMTAVQVSERAQAEDVMIYGVGIRSAVMPGMNVQQAIVSSFPDPSLGQLSDDTGGGYFELRMRDNPAGTFARVAEELRRQYLIGFAPPARDGKTHKVEVKVKGDGMKPRFRKNYAAAKPK